MPAEELERLIQSLEEEMHQAAKDLRFEYAARLRDEVVDLRKELKALRVPASPRRAALGYAMTGCPSVPVAWLGPGGSSRTPRSAATVDAYVAGPAASVRDADEELVVDGFLMPAVADRHVHIELSDPAAVLRRGVTAVRDLAWPAERIFPLADASEMPFSGPFDPRRRSDADRTRWVPDQADWAPAGTGRELNGPDDAVAVVADLAGRGAAAIKVSLNAKAGPTPTDPELTAICDAADAPRPARNGARARPGQVERVLAPGSTSSRTHRGRGCPTT